MPPTNTAIMKTGAITAQDLTLLNRAVCFSSRHGLRSIATTATSAIASSITTRATTGQKRLLAKGLLIMGEGWVTAGHGIVWRGRSREFGVRIPEADRQRQRDTGHHDPQHHGEHTAGMEPQGDDRRSRQQHPVRFAHRTRVEPRASRRLVDGGQK